MPLNRLTEGVALVNILRRVRDADDEDDEDPGCVVYQRISCDRVAENLAVRAS